jgi:hypothetical protein
MGATVVRALTRRVFAISDLVDDAPIMSLSRESAAGRLQGDRLFHVRR